MYTIYKSNYDDLFSEYKINLYEGDYFKLNSDKF